MKTRRWGWGVVLAGLLLGGAAFLLRPSSAMIAPASAGERSGAQPQPPTPAGRARTDWKPSSASLLITVLADGKPVPEASITLLHEESHDQMDFATRADGTQRVLSLPAGTYHLGVCHPRYMLATVHLPFAGSGPEKVTVELKAGARLEGRVQDRAGRRVAETTILLLDPRLGAPIAHDLAARSDAGGEFVMEGIPPGRYDVRFRREGYRSWVRGGLTVGGPGETHRIDAVLDEGTRLAGRVVGEAGEPIAGATVVASNGDPVTTRTDEQGGFVLQGLGETPVTCFASAPRYGVATLRGIAPGRENLEFRLPSAGAMSGRIDARPLPDRFNVQLCRFDPDFAQFYPLYAHVFDGAKGEEFHVPEVAPGRYRLRIQAEGYDSQDAPEVDVASGGSTSGIVVRLRKR